jgi:hypothetical protein
VSAMNDPVTAARGWLADCEWADDPDFASLTPDQVRRAVSRHYEGGWPQLLRDGDDEPGHDEATALAAGILGQYTAGWSPEDVRDALSDLSGVTVYTTGGGQPS